MVSPDERDINSAISDALESERQRLAARLRDDIINQASLIQSQIGAYQATSGPESQIAFSVLTNLVQQLLQQAYNLESNLNPTTLQSLGLAAAIEAFASQQRRITGANFTLDIQPATRRLPLQYELAIFRYVQELVEAAVVGRSSSQISIAYTLSGDTFHLHVRENGIDEHPEPGLTAARLLTLGIQVTHATSPYGGLATHIRVELAEPVQLTERERDVIALLAQGLTNKEIAYQLAVKPRTVKFHLDNIYGKLNVSTRTEAAIYAVQNGLAT